MDIHDIRLRRLQLLITERAEGKAARISEKTGISAGYFSRLWTDKQVHKRRIGEKIARRIEAAYELPRGWLDYDDSAEMTDMLLLAGYKAASAEGKEWMEAIARRALGGKESPDKDGESPG